MAWGPTEQKGPLCDLSESDRWTKQFTECPIKPLIISL